MMIDIDDFKGVNDQYDHSTGNDGLYWNYVFEDKKAKYPLIEPCWFGGDEFLIARSNSNYYSKRY